MLNKNHRVIVLPRKDSRFPRKLLLLKLRLHTTWNERTSDWKNLREEKTRMNEWRHANEQTVTLRLRINRENFLQSNKWSDNDVISIIVLYSSFLRIVLVPNELCTFHIQKCTCSIMIFIASPSSRHRKKGFYCPLFNFYFVCFQAYLKPKTIVVFSYLEANCQLCLVWQ